MLKWLSKTALDMLPSIVATVIGAYVVNYYIVPRANQANRAAITSEIAASKPTDAATADGKPEGDAARAVEKSEKTPFEKAVAEKNAIERTAERAAEKAEKTEGRRHAAVRNAGKPAVDKPAVDKPVADKPADKPTEAADDRRGVSDLARAAIERARLPDSARLEAARAEAPRSEPTRAPLIAAAVPTPPAPTAAPALPPLPAPVTVAAPSSDVFETGSAAPALQVYPAPAGQATPNAYAAGDHARLTPPGEIPAAQPIDLRAEASMPPARPSVAEDVVSATKSVFKALLPN